MHKLIGIDTGGTFTDAVLFDEARGVLAKAKALTTRGDLSLGIAAALDAVMARGGAAPSEIGMVSVSTTLATNALVEGAGGRVGLVTIGFSAADLERAGLAETVRRDAVVRLDGGHDVFGEERAPLDLEPLHEWLERERDSVTGFAVAGQFSVANPDHENRVRAAIAARVAAPVTCGHELSARLGAPKRALTAVLNARLIPIVHGLVEAAATLLARRGIAAPLMIVKGDGSLLSLEEARRKPVETILSGPAASLVGAGFLSGLPEAIVSDIGGTTTDIGLLRDGRPRLDPEGASVGGHATMVEAVRLSTFGLGADSDVALAPDGTLVLGPRRVIPVSLLAADHPDAVHRHLDRQLALTAPPETAGRFAVRVARAEAARLPAPERDLLEALGGGPCPLDTLLGAYRFKAALTRLVATGAVAVSGFCPSDAAHVLGLHAAWDAAAAGKAATLFARLRGPGGRAFAADGTAASRAVRDALVRESAERLLDAALAEDGFAGARPSRHPLLRAALDRRQGLAAVTARLTWPVVGLGASAATYYPAVGERLGAEMVVPRHAEVANAVGAVVGRVRAEALVTVSRPDEGRFRVQGGAAPRDFADLEAALAAAAEAAEAAARTEASRNGVPHPEVRVTREIVSARVADRDMILEWRFTAVATGRPSAGG